MCLSVTYGLGRVESGEGIHGRVLLRVELLLGSAAQDVGVALVQTEANLAINLETVRSCESDSIGNSWPYPLLGVVETRFERVSQVFNFPNSFGLRCKNALSGLK